MGATSPFRTLPRLAALALSALVLPAGAQVFKCVDASGHTTYQQAPCDKGSRGNRVELQTDNGSSRDSPEREAVWAAAVKSGQVVRGMPRRYVRELYGNPNEVRPGQTSERVSEVWSWRDPTGTRRIGFLDGFVVWDRIDDASTPDVVPPPITEGNEAAGARRQVAVGADCNEAIGALGRPDRSESAQAPMGGSAGGPLVGVVRHVYEPVPGDSQRLVVTCTEGRVGSVEREKP